jgi:ABC-2 type transport system permease protein
MGNLIKNELMKIFRRPGTYVMIGLLIFVISVAGIIIKSQESKGSVPDNAEWKQALIIQNQEFEKQLDEMGDAISRDQKAFFDKEIKMNEYRIENDISPNVDYSVWGFVTDASMFIELAGLFTIIVAAGIVASEFSWGTIKLLLIRPITRSKILLSKYVSVLIFGLLMISLLFSYSVGLGSILFGLPEQATPYLNYYEGKITEQNMLVHLIIFYGFKSISMVMLATMAFMISAVFRNSSLAIGLSIFLMFVGSQVTRVISMKYEWAKFSLFANTDLLQYFEGAPLVEGMTLSFSIMMLFVYLLLFHALTFGVFSKRDVAG